MEWWQAVILGIVEGLTEYLPVSSTGHLLLTAWLMGFADNTARWHAAFTYTVIIQAGAIFAVVGLYRQRIAQMFRGLAGRDAEGRKLAGNLLIAFLPAAVMGALFSDEIEHQLSGPWPIVAALFMGAWLMLVVAKERNIHGEVADAGRSLDAMDWRSALLIGFGQTVAMWPGTSRSMMTIVPALMLGFRAVHAAEFSFLLGLLTLTAATGFKLVKGGGQMFETFGLLPIIIGIVVATVSAALAIKWFVGALNRWGVAPFGWYRLALAVVLGALLWKGILGVPHSAVGNNAVKSAVQPTAPAAP
jgi:undecaprenyl-diphosphatase